MALAKRFPKIVVDTNRRIIDHGDIITAGGFLSWVDLGLFLVGRILGPAVRAETARVVLDGPEASEARYFTGFAPPQTHGDGAVLKAQEWVHMRDGRDVSLAALATAAGLERRTLLRRFCKCNGYDPNRVFSACSHCASARAPGGRRTLAERDCPSPRLQRRLPHLHEYFARLWAKRREPTAKGLAAKTSRPPISQRKMVYARRSTCSRRTLIRTERDTVILRPTLSYVRDRHETDLPRRPQFGRYRDAGHGGYER